MTLAVALLALAVWLGARWDASGSAEQAPEHACDSPQPVSTARQAVAGHAAKDPRVPLLGDALREHDRRIGELERRQPVPSSQVPAGPHVAPAATEANQTQAEALRSERRTPELAGGQADATEAVRETGRRLDEALGAEGFDPAWAPDMERALQEAVEGPDFPEVELVGTQCASTFCRLDLRFTSEQDRSRFGLRFKSAPIGMTMGAYFLLSEGWDDMEVEFYVADEGRALPARK